MTTNLLRANIERSIDVHSRLLDACLPALTGAADALVAAYRAGHKALFFGNGGSAADAQHLAAEFVGRYLRHPRPLPALALNANSSIVTAIVNDYGYEEVFARQIEALAVPGDVAVAIRRPTVRACECAYRCAIPRDAMHTGMSYPRRSCTCDAVEHAVVTEQAVPEPRG